MGLTPSQARRIIAEVARQWRQSSDDQKRLRRAKEALGKEFRKVWEEARVKK